MRNLGLAVVVAGSIAATGCATYPNQYGYDPYYNNGYNNGYGYNGYNNGYYYDSQGRRIATGAAVGAVGGAGAGAGLPGGSPGGGAGAGANLRGVAGAARGGPRYFCGNRGYFSFVRPSW